MKYLIILSLLISANAFATNPYGDIVTGTVTIPSAGTIVAATDNMTQAGPDHDYYSVDFNVSCSLACTVEMGIYNSTGTAINTFRQLILAGDGRQVRWTKVPLPDGHKFQIKVASGNLGTISGAIDTVFVNLD